MRLSWYLFMGLSVMLLSCAEVTTAETPGPVASEAASDANRSDFEYVPADSLLYRDICAMDSLFFAAYNTCDLETQAAMIAEDLEFYHDLGGLETRKSVIMESLEQNICGKVTRELVPGSIEVYPIPGLGAVEFGLHRFFNREEPEAPSNPSRFVTVWLTEEDDWKMSRIISLH